MDSAYLAQRYDLRVKQAKVLAEAILGRDLTPDQPTEYRAPDPTTRSHRELAISLLRERDGDRCYLCQRELEPTRTVIEHIIPLARGGQNEAENVGLACSTCNEKKGAWYVSIDVDRRAVYHRR